MKDVLHAINTTTRKSFFGRKPMYKPHAVVTDIDLTSAEEAIRCTLPSSLKELLCSIGYGDLNNELSFRKEWWQVLEVGQLKGNVVFAQDDRGNLYTFSPDTGEVHYIDRFDGSYAQLAPSFDLFLRGLMDRNFEVVYWAEHLPQQPYEFND